MTATHDLVRQVTQIEENQNALYDMHMQTHGWVRKIAGVQRKHGQRLESIDKTLKGHDSRLDRIESTQDEHTTKLDEILGILKAP